MKDALYQEYFASEFQRALYNDDAALFNAIPKYPFDSNAKINIPSKGEVGTSSQVLVPTSNAVRTATPTVEKDNKVTIDTKVLYTDTVIVERAHAATTPYMLEASAISNQADALKARMYQDGFEGFIPVADNAALSTGSGSFTTLIITSNKKNANNADVSAVNSSATVKNSATLTGDNIADGIAVLQRQNLDVTTPGKIWLVVFPGTAQELKKDANYLRADARGTDMTIRRGEIGMVQGAMVTVSNALPLIQQNAATATTASLLRYRAGAAAESADAKRNVFVPTALMLHTDCLACGAVNPMLLYKPVEPRSGGSEFRSQVNFGAGPSRSDNKGIVLYMLSY